MPNGLQILPLSFLKPEAIHKSPSFPRPEVAGVTPSAGCKYLSPRSHIHVLKAPITWGQFHNLSSGKRMEFNCTVLATPHPHFLKRKQLPPALDKRPHPFIHKYSKVFLHV